MNRKKGFQLNDFLIEIEKLDGRVCDFWYPITAGKYMWRLRTNNSNKLKENFSFKMNNLLPYVESKMKHNIYLILSYIIEVGHLFLKKKIILADYELRYFSVYVHKMIYIYNGVFAQVKFPTTIFVFSQKKINPASALFVV